MFNKKNTSIPGCFEIQPQCLKDARGEFVKIFHQNTFTELGLETNFAEEYYSHSHRGVIRGMHFQTPPAEHVKVVYCVQGEVFDVVVDLRLGSPSYGQPATVNLSAQQANFLYIPKGVAHGFCAISEIATLIYKVSTVYAPEYDQGILWNSIDIPWPTKTPLISERDANFPKLSDFQSPFTFK